MPGAAGVDDRRHAGADAEDVGVGSEGAEAGHKMEMDVDQSRHDNKIFRVYDLRIGGRQIRPDRLDEAVADEDIESAVALGGRIEHAAVLNQQVRHPITCAIPSL